jgi:hypothetical protein
MNNVGPGDVLRDHRHRNGKSEEYGLKVESIAFSSPPYSIATFTVLTSDDHQRLTLSKWTIDLVEVFNPEAAARFDFTEPTYTKKSIVSVRVGDVLFRPVSATDDEYGLLVTSVWRNANLYLLTVLSSKGGPEVTREYHVGNAEDIIRPDIAAKFKFDHKRKGEYTHKWPTTIVVGDVIRMISLNDGEPYGMLVAAIASNDPATGLVLTLIDSRNPNDMPTKVEVGKKTYFDVYLPAHAPKITPKVVVKSARSFRPGDLIRRAAVESAHEYALRVDSIRVIGGNIYASVESSREGAMFTKKYSADEEEMVFLPEYAAEFNFPFGVTGEVRDDEPAKPESGLASYTRRHVTKVNVYDVIRGIEESTGAEVGFRIESINYDRVKGEYVFTLRDSRVPDADTFESRYGNACYLSIFKPGRAPSFGKRTPQAAPLPSERKFRELTEKDSYEVEPSQVKPGSIVMDSKARRRLFLVCCVLNGTPLVWKGVDLEANATVTYQPASKPCRVLHSGAASVVFDWYHARFPEATKLEWTADEPDRPASSRSDPGRMTGAEVHLVAVLGCAWNLFIRLPEQRVNQTPEFRHAIHLLQNIVSARPIDRTHDRELCRAMDTLKPFLEWSPYTEILHAQDGASDKLLRVLVSRLTPKKNPETGEVKVELDLDEHEFAAKVGRNIDDLTKRFQDDIAGIIKEEAEKKLRRND